jgi:uncharacterized linocin/CFP29 family protein
MQLGREQLPWTQDVWHQIQGAIDENARSTKVGAKFIPVIAGIPSATTVPTNQFNPAVRNVPPDAAILEAAIWPVAELYFQFSMSRPQVEREPELGIARQLAAEGARELAVEEDRLIFNQFAQANPNVVIRNFAPPPPPPWPDLYTSLLVVPHLPVPRDPPGNPLPNWGANTLAGVLDAIQLLQQRGYYGPHASVLSTGAFANTHQLIAGTSTAPADRIRPIVAAGFFPCGPLPNAVSPPVPINPNLPPVGANVRPVTESGVVLSVDASSVDLVYGCHPVLEFVQIDTDGLFQFRVYQRFTFRLRNPFAVVALDFA